MGNSSINPFIDTAVKPLDAFLFIQFWYSAENEIEMLAREYDGIYVQIPSQCKRGIEVICGRPW